MIDLTPLDVRKKKEDFKRTVRGYDPMQVDAFLDVVADRLEQLVREHGSFSDKVENLQQQLSSYQERERALNEALLAAQELREEARSQSERDASVRLREAETHAEAILLDADQAIRHSQRRLEDLRLRRGQYLKSLATMLERFEDYLELENTRLDAEPDDLGDLLERLQTDIAETPPAAAGGRDTASPDFGPADVDLASQGEAGAARTPEEPYTTDESTPSASAAPEVTRNGDTPHGPDVSSTDGNETAAFSATEGASRIPPESITPPDAGGSGAASS